MSSNFILYGQWTLYLLLSINQPDSFGSISLLWHSMSRKLAANSNKREDVVSLKNNKVNSCLFEYDWTNGDILDECGWLGSLGIPNFGQTKWKCSGTSIRRYCIVYKFYQIYVHQIVAMFQFRKAEYLNLIPWLKINSFYTEYVNLKLTLGRIVFIPKWKHVTTFKIYFSFLKIKVIEKVNSHFKLFSSLLISHRENNWKIVTVFKG